MGNSLQFQGDKLAGFAAADMVQAYPLVTTVWDVILFGEFRHATKQVLIALILVYVTYLLGIVLLASSIEY
jgi:drug/metabolite transporter (DMT)-like permease